MSVQTSYGFSTQPGVPGGLYDLSNHVIDARMFNNATEGVLKFGMGVVIGETPGSDVSLPQEEDTLASFEGITVNGYTTQQDLDGVVSIQDGKSVGVLSSGRIWARLKEGTTAVHGNRVYLITSGEYAGYFTNTVDDSDEDDAESLMELPARFVGNAYNSVLAPVEMTASRY